MVDALRKSVCQEKGHNGVKNTFTEWARYWYKDLGASKAGEEAHVVTDGPGLKEPAHLAAFLAYWLTWYIFPGPSKDGVDTTLFEPAAILASGESVLLAPLFLGTLLKRLDMLQDAARRSCGRYDLPIYVATNFLHMFLFERFPKVTPKPNDFGASSSGGRGNRAEMYVGQRDGQEDELYDEGGITNFVNGRYGSVMYDPMRVARQFGFDQGVPKPFLPSVGVGDGWKRFLKSAFRAELRSMNIITLPGAKRMGGCTKLYREYWRDNLVRFLEYVKKVPMSLGVEDVMSQDGELCLSKVKDPVLASFGACSPYVKEEVLGRVKEHLETIYGTGEKDGGSSASLSDRAEEGRAEGVRLSGKHTSKRSAKDVAEVAQPSKRKKTTKGNKESVEAVQPGVVEEVIRTPRVEIPKTETGGGSEVPSTSVEGVSSRRVPQLDVVEEGRKTPRVEVSEMAARGGLNVPLDSLKAIGQAGVNHMEGGDGGESLVQNSSSLQDETNVGGLRSSRRWWKEGDFMIARYPDGSVIVTLETKEKRPSTFVRLVNMSTFSRRLALVSLVSFVELLEDVSLPKATPEEFIYVYDGLAALRSYQLEVDWLRKRIDQMAFLFELPAWRDRLEKVSKELEEIEATAARLRKRKRKKKLEGEVAERKSALSGDFDMSSHAGQGLWR
ncbi:hypothetical protein RHSIM_Rhsim05G0166200 [Rhododendron simsii]|uniref:Aminotransferase-like plant mobile domain-containing protein n=1 Tax=Rhododendron simsii TaxID=118357 RepID=A0A834LQR5_RHOSS|nr:hypothetical protein RHSIM_Rhsim05G0166200 [Rhododendron simsii]